VISKVDVNLSNRFGQAVIKISGLKSKNLTTLIEKGVAMASGWESEGPRFKPRLLQATFDPGLPKKNK